jgi:ribosome biogenesis GTPase / thiamine phosphate phosphatase
MFQIFDEYLLALGWNSVFQGAFDAIKEPGDIPARVVSESKGSWTLDSVNGESIGTLAGRFYAPNHDETLYPAVGDWVVFRPIMGESKGVIHAVLPRKSKFSRKTAGDKTEEQVVSANVDTVFIVNGLDGGRNFNLRRIERYLTLSWSSGAQPVIVLNKSDCCPDLSKFIGDVEGIAIGVPIFAVSAKTHSGIESLKAFIEKGKTVAFLGSSGVGKSSLINTLLGFDRQKVNDVRQDDLQGHHTTTRRELIRLPDGGNVIDTPGMREIQLWAGMDDIDVAFADISDLSCDCRFKDCSHQGETGCAVITAVDSGLLSSSRLESYLKMKRELSYTLARETQNAQAIEKGRWKNVAKLRRQINKDR